MVPPAAVRIETLVAFSARDRDCFARRDRRGARSGTHDCGNTQFATVEWTATYSEVKGNSHRYEVSRRRFKAGALAGSSIFNLVLGRLPTGRPRFSSASLSHIEALLVFAKRRTPWQL